MNSKSTQKIIVIVCAAIALLFLLVNITIYTKGAPNSSTFNLMPISTLVSLFSGEMTFGNAAYSLFNWLLNLLATLSLFLGAMGFAKKNRLICIAPFAVWILVYLISVIRIPIMGGSISISASLVTPILFYAVPLVVFLVIVLNKNQDLSKIALIAAAVFAIAALVALFVGWNPFGAYHEAYKSSYSSYYSSPEWHAYFITSCLRYIATCVGAAFLVMLSAPASDAVSNEDLVLEASVEQALLSEEAPKPSKPSKKKEKKPAFEDVANEMKGYKELLEMGAITQEEFDAKKTELLGL